MSEGEKKRRREGVAWSWLFLTFVAAPFLYFTDSKEREMLGISCQLLILLLKMMMRWRTLMFARRRREEKEDCYYNFLSLEIDRMMLERSLDFFLIQSCITDWIRSREMRVFSYCLGERKTFSLSLSFTSSPGVTISIGWRGCGRCGPSCCYSTNTRSLLQYSFLWQTFGRQEHTVFQEGDTKGRDILSRFQEKKAI